MKPQITASSCRPRSTLLIAKAALLFMSDTCPDFWLLSKIIHSVFATRAFKKKKSCTNHVVWNNHPQALCALLCTFASLNILRLTITFRGFCPQHFGGDANHCFHHQTKKCIPFQFFAQKPTLESGFSREIGINPPNSGRLDTLQGFFGGPETCSPGKNRNLGFSNCLKCIEIINPTITTLFFYRFKSFKIPSGGPF